MICGNSYPLHWLADRSVTLRSSTFIGLYTVLRCHAMFHATDTRSHSHTQRTISNYIIIHVWNCGIYVWVSACITTLSCLCKLHNVQCVYGDWRYLFTYSVPEETALEAMPSDRSRKPRHTQFRLQSMDCREPMQSTCLPHLPVWFISDSSSPSIHVVIVFVFFRHETS